MWTLGRLCLSVGRLARRRGALTPSNAVVAGLALLTLVGVFDVMQDLATLRVMQINGHVIMEQERETLVSNTPSVQLDAAELEENFGRRNDAEDRPDDKRDMRRKARRSRLRSSLNRLPILPKFHEDSPGEVPAPGGQASPLGIPEGPPVGLSPNQVLRKPLYNQSTGAQFYVPERLPGNLPLDVPGRLPGNLPGRPSSGMIQNPPAGVPGIDQYPDQREPGKMLNPIQKSGDMGQKVPGNIHGPMSLNLPQGLPGNPSQNLPAAIPAQFPEPAPGGLPGQLPVQLPGRLPGPLPGQLPGGSPGQLPGQLPGGLPGPNPRQVVLGAPAEDDYAGDLPGEDGGGDPVDIRDRPKVMSDAGLLVDNAPRVCTQAERLRHVRDTCRRLQLTQGSNRMKHGLIADSLNTIYCQVPMATDMNWKTALAVATGRWKQARLPFIHYNILEELGIWQYLSYPSADWGEALRSYFKFIAVRNPLDRLVSIWRSKMGAKNSAYSRNIGQNIIKRYRKAGTQVDPQFENIVLFEEFTEFLKDSRMMDRYWRPIHKICNPCGIKWDAIVRVETIPNDAPIVTDRLPRFNWTLPIFPPAEQANINTNLSAYYSKVSKEALRYILQMYSADMEVFGYEWDAANHIAKCKIKTANGDYCC